MNPSSKKDIVCDSDKLCQICSKMSAFSYLNREYDCLSRKIDESKIYISGLKYNTICYEVYCIEKYMCQNDFKLENMNDNLLPFSNEMSSKGTYRIISH